MYSNTAKTRDTVKASVALVICLAILGAFVVVLGGYRFWETLDMYTIRFRSVKDLSTGRPVKYGGLDVGRIMSIGVDQDDPRLIRVMIGLNRTIVLRQGVKARIAQKGLVGDYYVFLDPQGELGEPLSPGTQIPSVESVDISQLAGMAGEILLELRPRLERIAESLESILAGDNARHLSAALAQAPQLLEELRKTATQVRTDFAGLSGSGREAMDAARKTLVSVEKAVNDLKKELQDTLTQMRAEVRQVGQLTDSVQRAVDHDQARVEDILANVERLSEDMRQLGARLRERPWELITQPRERTK